MRYAAARTLRQSRCILSRDAPVHARRGVAGQRLVHFMESQQLRAGLRLAELIRLAHRNVHVLAHGQAPGFAARGGLALALHHVEKNLRRLGFAL